MKTKVLQENKGFNTDTIADKLNILYRHFDHETLLYIGMSIKPFKRIISHVSNSEWNNRISHITFEKFDTHGELKLAEKKAIQGENPI